MARGDTLEGKVALITGGAHGQGAAEGRLFGGGAPRWCWPTWSTPTARNWPTRSAAQYLHLDVTSEEEWETVVADVVATHGRLDVLVNNAGIFRSARLVEETTEQWDQVIARQPDRRLLGHAGRRLGPW